MERGQPWRHWFGRHEADSRPEETGEVVAQAAGEVAVNQAAVLLNSDLIKDDAAFNAAVSYIDDRIANHRTEEPPVLARRRVESNLRGVMYDSPRGLNSEDTQVLIKVNRAMNFRRNELARRKHLRP